MSLPIENSVADPGDPLPLLFWVKKGTVTEGRKADWISKTTFSKRQNKPKILRATNY